MLPWICTNTDTSHKTVCPSLRKKQDFLRSHYLRWVVEERKWSNLGALSFQQEKNQYLCLRIILISLMIKVQARGNSPLLFGAHMGIIDAHFTTCSVTIQTNSLDGMTKESLRSSLSHQKGSLRRTVTQWSVYCSRFPLKPTESPLTDFTMRLQDYRRCGHVFPSLALIELPLNCSPTVCRWIKSFLLLQHRAVRQSIHVSIHPHIHPSTYPSMQPLMYPSMYPSVRPSVRPAIYPSICPLFWDWIFQLFQGDTGAFLAHHFQTTTAGGSSQYGKIVSAQSFCQLLRVCT